MPDNYLKQLTDLHSYWLLHVFLPTLVIDIFKILVIPIAKEVGRGNDRQVLNQPKPEEGISKVTLKWILGEMNCEQISQSIGKSFTFFYEPDMLCPHLIKLYKENHKKFPQRPLGKSRWFHLDCECCKPPETLSFFQGHTEFLLEILPDFTLGYLLEILWFQSLDKSVNLR